MWKLWPITLLSVIVVSLSACDKQPVTSERPDETPKVLPIVREYGEMEGPYGRPIRLAIRSQEALLTARLGQVQADFNTEMVLLLTLGKVDNTAYAIKVREVHEYANRIVVLADIWAPSKDRPGTHAPASPWTAVVVPRSNKPVERFETNPVLVMRRNYNPFR